MAASEVGSALLEKPGSIAFSFSISSRGASHDFAGPYSSWRTRSALPSSSSPFSESGSSLTIPCRCPFPKEGLFPDNRRNLVDKNKETSKTESSKKGKKKLQARRKGRSKMNIAGLYTQSERWEFLKQIPHQLIRDIAFVIACPSIFFDPDKLPLVSKDMVGECDDTWQIAADWIKGLDALKVAEWFEARRYTTRLGDYFATCIEFILKFSPLVVPDPLYISQQVGTYTVLNKGVLNIQKPKGKFGFFNFKDGGVMSDVIIKQLENDVLVKRFSTLSFDRSGRFKEVRDSDIEHLVAEFKQSTFDYVEKGIQPENTLQINQDSSAAPISLKNSEYGSFESQSIRLDLNHRRQKTWRLHYSSHLRKKQLCQKVGLPEFMSGTKSNSALSDGMINHPETVDGGSFTGKKGPTHSSASKPVSIIERSKSVKIPKVKKGNKEWPAKIPKRIVYEKGDTAGECDFLFKANAGTGASDLSDYAWTEVHHWEASLQFLSYFGPWEVFGLATPGSAVWNRGGKGIFATTEGLDRDIVNLYDYWLNNASKDRETEAPWILDGCYAATSVGDSWYSRKKDMGVKLALCRFENAAAKIANLFHSSLREQELPAANKGNASEVTDLAADSEKRKPLYGPNGENYNKYRHDPSIIRIKPRALTKGYLFYEPNLWLALTLQRAEHGSSVDVRGGRKPENILGLKEISTSYLSPDHWIGWWVCANEFAEFALSEPHKNNMWYIAPRHEWLSPVVIGKWETNRCHRIYDLVGFLCVSSKVAEESAKLKPPRKRRFMVVEVSWDPALHTSPVNPFKQKASSSEPSQDSEEKGAWVEVSRGFVVEESWPDSKDVRGHGFTLSWSPALLGWS